MTSILIDSGFLAALYDPQDTNYSRAREFVDSDDNVHLIPQVILSEVAFLINRSGGVPALARFVQALSITQPVLETITASDLQRSGEIMLMYRTARLDFVDCCIMALSERLNITQVATFDRRDFTIFRPSHCSHLDLLP